MIEGSRGVNFKWRGQIRGGGGTLCVTSKSEGQDIDGQNYLVLGRFRWWGTVNWVRRGG